VNEETQMRLGLYSRFWVGVTITLSVIVIACGFPAFQRKFGFPASLLWTLAVVVGVWTTYLVRAYLFSDRLPRNRAQRNRSRGQPR
jgi:ABC-type spermidine/putrescine transport system permease subunit I